MDTKDQNKGVTHDSSTRAHWDSVYDRKSPDQVSWFQPRAETSLGLIEAAGVTPDRAVIDVGGGASTLVDNLLDRDFSDITLLDISRATIETNRARLGPLSGKVRWIVGDVLEFHPDRTWDLWHDRACFHFMTSTKQRQSYVRSLERAVAAGGACIIAAFAPDGPRRCSGLDIVQYDADGLLAQLGRGWQLQRQVHELHPTPSGSTQSFNYFLVRRA